jgi:hypothetical protein
MMSNMMLKRNVILAAAFSAGLMAGATPGFAGFEWKPPSGSGAAPAVSSPAMPAQKVQAVEAMPVLTESEKKTMPEAPSEVVSGFGKDLPLTVALQQVIPAGHGFSLASGVSGDTSVSWKGDRPWKQVLTDMLAERNLGFSFQGDDIVVSQAAGGAHHASVAAASSKADLIPNDMFLDNKSSSSATEMPADLMTKEVAPMSTPTEAASNPAETMSNPAEPVTIRRERPEMAALPDETSMTPLPDAAASPSTPAPVESNWRGMRGQTLRAILDNWSRTAQVELYWPIDYDYKMNEDVAYGGTYDQAVQSLLDQFSKVRPQPYGRLYKGKEGGRVLVVNSYDLTN